jgi:hypothetical protein
MLLKWKLYLTYYCINTDIVANEDYLSVKLFKKPLISVFFYSKIFF